MLFMTALTMMSSTSSGGFLDEVASPLDQIGSNGYTDLGVWDLVKIVLALVVVIGLMLGLLYLAKRYLPSSVGGQNSGSVRICSSRYLGSKKSLVVVKAHGKTMLLGLTSQHISFISDLPDPVKEKDVTDKSDESGVVPAHSRGAAGIHGL